MPNVTVYIRNEDLAKWKALNKKSAFVSFWLNNHIKALEAYYSKNQRPANFSDILDAAAEGKPLPDPSPPLKFFPPEEGK